MGGDEVEEVVATLNHAAEEVAAALSVCDGALSLGRARSLSLSLSLARSLYLSLSLSLSLSL